MPAARAEWAEATGDPAFVERLFGAVDKLKPAIAAAQAAGTPIVDAVPGLSATVATLHAVAEAAAKQLDRAEEGGNPDAVAKAAAKAALVGDLSEALESLTAPNDPAETMNWIGEQAAAASLGRADAETRAAADAARDIAEQLAALDSAARTEEFGAKWPPQGVAVLFEHMPADRLGAAAADIMRATADDPAYGLAVCTAALERSAARAVDADGMLDSSGAASLLLAAYCAPGTDAYGHALAASPGTLPEKLLRVPVPGVLAATGAALHDAAQRRFDSDTAWTMVRAHAVLRMLGSATGDDAATSALLADAGLQDELNRFLDQLLRAGTLARSAIAAGDDPDDLLVQRGAALADRFSLADTFEDPSPEDPLGAMPALTVTALGQALLAARQLRSTDYDWAAVLELEEEDPERFLGLIEDERLTVMDLLTLPDGSRPWTEPS